MTETTQPVSAAELLAYAIAALRRAAEPVARYLDRATRKPLTVADIPDGRGPASLYVDAESTAVMYRTAKGRSVPVPAMWIPTDSDGIDALNAALSALAATLPHVTTEEEA